jgi:riboflavin kinase/FMN adenylyltransferase
MKLTRITYPFKIEHKPVAICFGYFDGIHKGHMGLVNKAKEMAKLHHLEAALFTFEPNPNFVLGKIEKEEMLTTLEDRYLRLKELGMDEMIIANFTREVASLSPEAFIENYIVGLNAKYVIVGFDFHFGFKGQGNYQVLKDLAKGRYEVEVIDEIKDEGRKIASSWIVSLVKQGDIEKANYLLDQPYKIKGKVVKGFGRGKTLDFPTINIKSNGVYIFPKTGVYAVKVKLGSKEYYGMANVGRHPTFDLLDEDIIEVNIFDFNQSVYNKKVEISFYKFIRDEVKFASADELANQLKQDKKQIQDYFSLSK